MRISKRLALMVVLTLLAGILVGFPVGQAIGPVQRVLEEVVEEKTNPGRVKGIIPGVIPKEMVLHFGGRVVDSIEGPWQIGIEGTLSRHIVFAACNPREGSGEEIPEGYKTKIIDVGPEGLHWCYELEDWVHVNDARRLDNGNYLFLASNGGYEVTPEGEEVAFIRIPGATHHLDKLPNGNYLVVSAIENRVYEVTGDEEIVWSWDAYWDLKNSPVREEYFPCLEDDIYTPTPERGLGDWIHMNYAQRLENGNTIVSLWRLDLVVEVTPSKDVVRTFGALFLKHQHTPVYLPESDSLLIFDNGHDRVVEVDWKTQKVIWEYTDLHSVINGSCQRLDNGSTLICDSCQGRIIEVTPDKEIVWELTVPGMQIYRAFGYGE